MIDPTTLVRENIRNLRPYSSARDEFMGSSSILLDANENPYNTGLNRYPDPRQTQLKKKIASVKGVEPDKIFLGNGSDEAIDLLIRAYCQPGIHKAIELPPTYGMYRVSTEINQVEMIQVPLDASFQPQPQMVLDAADSDTRMLFLCSPNNPTGNAIDQAVMEHLIRKFQGIVVVDEAYIDFSAHGSILPWIEEFENLVVLQTFSKVWGMAGLRLGMAFSSPTIQHTLQTIKPPYNINSLTQQKAMEVLEDTTLKDMWVTKILDQRDWLESRLRGVKAVERICPSDANFLLVKFKGDSNVYEYLKNDGIVVRDRSQALEKGHWLRITVGTAQENQKLIESLKNL